MPIFRAFKNLVLKFLTLIFYTPSQKRYNFATRNILVCQN
nr:MAG TPA: hypothetical protein [Caudoviricetes sp.]